MQKEKQHPKLFTCGIAIGKLAEETQLGGLNSLITNAVPVTSSTDSHSSNAIPSSPTSPSLISSSSSYTAANILKPPKKRYIVNGEFQCHSPSSNVALNDNPTHSACSALLQLAEICANTDGKKPVVLSDRKDSSEEKTALNGPSTSLYKCTTAFSIHQCVQESQVSSIQSDLENLGDLYLPRKASVIQCSNSIKNSGPEVIPEHQDEPLNLCKEKEKTYWANNQKLIDHFVDKFLCDTNSHDSSGFKPTLDPFSDLLSSSVKHNKHHQKMSENRSGCFEFSLSAAIESVVDQVYNKDLHEMNKISQSKPVRAVEQDVNACGTKLINSFSSAISGNSEIHMDETFISENPCDHKKESISAEDQRVPPIPTEKEAFCLLQSEVQPGNALFSETETKASLTVNSFEKIEPKIEENESKCRLSSPPKKSRMWCNIFMDEQQKCVNESEAINNKRNLASEISSPVRRNSQRTCKGRRYQALITEGLLQSTKERKIAAIKKHVSLERPSKTKSPTSGEIHSVLKSSRKKRKKDSGDQTETEGSDFEKSLCDTDEKISSLLDCPEEGLKLDCSINADDSKQQCDSSHTSQDVVEMFSCSDHEIKTVDSSADKDISPSVGRFKPGFPVKRP